MNVKESSLTGREYTLIGSVSNIRLYKRELSKHVTSLAVTLLDTTEAYNTRVMLIDTKMLDLVLEALKEKRLNELAELLQIKYY